MGHLSALEQLNLSECKKLTTLPVSMAYLPFNVQVMWDLRMLPPQWSRPDNRHWVFPPVDVVQAGMSAIREFLLAHHRPLKMLLLIMAARRRRMRHPPAELWVLITDEFLPLLDQMHKF
jgi:hypothetical protein